MNDGCWWTYIIFQRKNTIRKKFPQNEYDSLNDLEKKTGIWNLLIKGHKKPLPTTLYSSCSVVIFWSLERLSPNMFALMDNQGWAVCIGLTFTTSIRFSPVCEHSWITNFVRLLKDLWHRAHWWIFCLLWTRLFLLLLFSSCGSVECGISSCGTVECEINLPEPLDVNHHFCQTDGVFSSFLQHLQYTSINCNQ